MRKLTSAVLLFACSTMLGAMQAQDTNSNAQVLGLLRKGQQAIAHGDLPGAEATFRSATELAPTLSDGFLGLGLVQLRRGEMDDAVRALTRATELNGQLPGAHLFLGIAQFQTGHPDEAALSLQEEVKLRPGNGEALTWLGIVELGRDQPAQATDPLDRAAALNPKDARVLYYQGRAHMLVAEAAFRRLNDLDPDSALVHRGMAESYEISGQTEKAIAEYEAAVKKDPTNPDLYDELGAADQKMSRIDAARAAYQQELTLNPGSAIALYNLGRLDVERGAPVDGVALLRKAQAAHASPAPTDFYLGLGLAEVGQNAEAAKWLEQSLANQPSPFVAQGAWYQLARVYAKLNRQADAQTARGELKKIIAAQDRQKELTAKEAERRSSQPVDGAPAAGQP